MKIECKKHFNNTLLTTNVNNNDNKDYCTYFHYKNIIKSE